MNLARMNRQTFSILVSSGMVIGWVGGSLKAVEPRPPQRIAFVRGDFGHANQRKIYLVRADGTEDPRRFTKNADDVGEDRPSWSPDGRLIVYSVRSEGRARIYFQDVEGRFEQCLTPDSHHDEDPCWSPDGRRIAFTRWSNDRSASHIHIMSSDGTEERQLTQGGAYDWMPCWMPDSEAIVFESTRDGNREIYRINLDGSGLKNLSKHEGTDHAPAVSLVDGRIAMMTGRDFGNAEIGVLNLNDGKLTNVTNHPARDSEPAWSRDGKWIAFARSQADKPMDIWVSRSDGQDARNLTNSTDLDSWAPAWEP